MLTGNVWSGGEAKGSERSLVALRLVVPSTAPEQRGGDGYPELLRHCKRIHALVL